MTKTYHDVEAVTRLLEEKEKDLELAAKIGQELLERNKGNPADSLCFLFLVISVPDPPDPHVIGPPGSVSISQWYGPGSGF
jgi:hypothetical protein